MNIIPKRIPIADSIRKHQRQQIFRDARNYYQNQFKTSQLLKPLLQHCPYPLTNITQTMIENNLDHKIVAEILEPYINQIACQIQGLAQLSSQMILLCLIMREFPEKAEQRLKELFPLMEANCSKFKRMKSLWAALAAVISVQNATCMPIQMANRIRSHESYCFQYLGQQQLKFMLRLIQRRPLEHCKQVFGHKTMRELVKLILSPDRLITQWILMFQICAQLLYLDNQYFAMMLQNALDRKCLNVILLYEEHPKLCKVAIITYHNLLSYSGEDSWDLCSPYIQQITEHAFVHNQTNRQLIIEAFMIGIQNCPSNVRSATLCWRMGIKWLQMCDRSRTRILTILKSLACTNLQLIMSIKNSLEQTILLKFEEGIDLLQYLQREQEIGKEQGSIGNILPYDLLTNYQEKQNQLI